MPLTTKDVRVNGYPPLDEILAYFDAIPALLEACREHCPQVVEQWLGHVQVAMVDRVVQPVTKKAERLFELEQV